MKKKVQRPGYQAVQLEDGWILSYHEKLQVHIDPARKLLLLGYAWQVLPERGSPLEEIEKAPLTDEGILSEKSILEMEESWCGRYLLISNGSVYTDPAAVLAVFYSDAGISSDISILAEEAGYTPVVYQAEGKPMNWFPAPLTPYENIYRMLPSQIYDYHTKNVRGRQLLAQNWKRDLKEEELISEFTRMFCASLNNMHALFPEKKLLVALTGGYDSRLLFAMMLKAGLDFDAYTFQHGNISRGDIDVPPELCRITKTRHIYYSCESMGYSQERHDEFMTHISGLVWETDRFFYAYEMYQKLIKQYGDVVFLRSGIYEAVQEYNRRIVSNPFNPQEIYNHYELVEGSPERKSLEAFFKWCAGNPQEISDCNRFNWELISGCWLGSTEQSFDLYEHALSFHPVNCRLLLTMLHSFPLIERQEKYHQAKITAYACPAIADVPYGSRTKAGLSLMTRVMKKVNKAWNRLKKTGLRNTIKTYQRIFSDMRQASKFSKKH